MEWRYICVRKERAEIPAHASNLAACDSNCRIAGPGTCKVQVQVQVSGPAAPAPGRPRRQCQSFDFECRVPGPGVAQFTEPESGRRRGRGCPAAPAARSGVSDTRPGAAAAAPPLSEQWPLLTQQWLANIRPRIWHTRPRTACVTANNLFCIMIISPSSKY